MTLQNETLVLNFSSTTTGSEGMNLVLRQGVLRHRDAYIFTLHVTDSSLDGEGVASITLHHNMPPAGGECHLTGGGEGGVEYGDGDSEVWRIRSLLDQVHFSCSGRNKEAIISLSHLWITNRDFVKWIPQVSLSSTHKGRCPLLFAHFAFRIFFPLGYSDLGVSETPLLYSLLVMRCREDYCEDFCVYKGSSPEHSAFLPPGFSSAQHRVAVSITVEDHQGAAITALNK